MKYNYYDEVTLDVCKYIDENVDFADYSSLNELAESLYDELWIEDSVTGNASGSYTFNAWQAEENICHNGDLIEEMKREFGIESINYGDPEGVDVSLRCFVLGEAIAAALKQYEDDFEAAQEEEE